MLDLVDLGAQLLDLLMNTAALLGENLLHLLDYLLVGQTVDIGNALRKVILHDIHASSSLVDLLLDLVELDLLSSNLLNDGRLLNNISGRHIAELSSQVSDTGLDFVDLSSELLDGLSLVLNEGGFLSA